jgi:hypothetical protein
MRMINVIYTKKKKIEFKFQRNAMREEGKNAIYIKKKEIKELEIQVCSRQFMIPMSIPLCDM